MSIRLSHTAKELYLRCPLAYYMHYVLGYRSETVGSALPFGSAFDEAQAELLKGKTLDQAIKKFNKLWEKPKVNNEILDGPNTNKITYYGSDTKEGLADTGWESLKIKGELMLKAYQEDIMPEIKDVLSIQEPIMIKNDVGDYIMGFADIVIESKDGRKLVIDNKTSSKSYPTDAVVSGDKAKQLALYYEALKNKYKLDGAGFFVSEKYIRKREPQTRTQILTGVIPEEIIQETFDEFDQVLYNIRMGRFQSNHPDCNSYFGNCICNLYAPSEGHDTTGLVKVKRGKK